MTGSSVLFWVFFYLRLSRLSSASPSNMSLDSTWLKGISKSRNAMQISSNVGRLPASPSQQRRIKRCFHMKHQHQPCCAIHRLVSIHVVPDKPLGNRSSGFEDARRRALFAGCRQRQSLGTGLHAQTTEVKHIHQKISARRAQSSQAERAYLPEQDAVHVHVDGLGERPPAQQLWRHVRRGSGRRDLGAVVIASHELLTIAPSEKK